MSNFAKYENLQALFTAIGKKKLSVSDTMPTAGAAYEDICILYIGPTDANYTKGYVYECEEVTPATDPKTYSWNAKINVDVDLSKYKTIFPGTKEEWEALTEAQQDQYDYCFFDGDESDYYAVSDEVTEGDMHPVTSNAVADILETKADKVSDATNGNFAGLDENGNLTDSGKKPSDFQTALTFDNAPTENSNNPVKSGGVYSADANIHEVMGRNGAKNFVALNRSPYREQSTPNVSSISTQTEDELIFTTVNGNFAQVLLFYSLPIGTYKVSCDISSSDSFSPKVGVYLKNGNQDIRNVKISDGETKEFTITNEITHIEIACLGTESSSTAAVRTVTFRNLMIRLASDTDSTYQPYAKTNKQLTEDKAEQAEVNDIVNVYGAKNILRYPYYHTTRADSGMTIMDNGDGSITISGTATARVVFRLADNAQVPAFTPPVGTYKLVVSGNSAGLYINFDAYNNITWVKTLATIHDNGISASFDVDYNGYNKVTGYIDIPSGTAITTPITIKPMIVSAHIEDTTWVPYVPTNAQLLSADTNAVLGAHQFLNCTLASIKSVNTSGTWNNNVYTLNDVTFTINNDLSVSISGTASNNCIFVFKLKEDISLIESKKYSGISGGSSSTIWLLVEYYNNNSWVGEKKVYDGAETLIAPSTANKVNLEVYVKSGASINKTIYPLLSLASDPSTIYAPYAMTNKELTTSVTTNAKNISTINKGTLDLDAIELTANTPKKVISSYGVYLITFNHGGGAPGGLYLVQVHATDVNGMQVAVIKESTDRTVTFDKSVVNQLTVTASGNGRMRIIKLDASNY